jgi:hypothetical protein
MAGRFMNQACRGKFELPLVWPDAIPRHQFACVGIILGHAGAGDRGTAFIFHGDFLVQGEEWSEEILLGAEAVGDEDGGVERGKRFVCQYHGHSIASSASHCS